MYDILMDGKVAGSAEIAKEGLYYRFSCVCTVPLTGIHRILLSDGENQVDLGICVPTGAQFTVVRRLPIKKFAGNNFTFTLVADKKEKTTIPVADGEPFGPLDKLDEARLQLTDEGTEIVIGSIQDQLDSDPIQEFQNKWEQL